jgi:hypothetical protein
MEIHEIETKIHELENLLDLKVKSQLFSELKKLFDQYPALETVGYPAYTPSFNDGDPCHFGIHTDDECDIQVNGVTYSNLEEEYDANNPEDYPLSLADVKFVGNTVGNLLDRLPHDSLKRLFNNYREGIVEIDRDLKVKIQYYDGY